MKTLCINTAFAKADLAIDLDGNYSKKSFDEKSKHSETIMLGIDSLLAGNKVGDLDCMSVVVGCGSFTGIRIGIAVAEGFKTANNNLKLVSVSSFELALQSISQLPTQKFAIVFNALGGRYFVQYFEGKKSLGEPILLYQDQILPVKLFGLDVENLPICQQYFSFDSNALMAVTNKKIAQKDFVEFLQPLYIRQSQAEENLAKSRGQTNNNFQTSSADQITKISDLNKNKMQTNIAKQSSLTSKNLQANNSSKTIVSDNASDNKKGGIL